MAHAKDVVFALLPFGEAGDAFVLPQGRKSCLAAGYDFMDVSLVAYVEYDFIPG